MQISKKLYHRKIQKSLRFVHLLFLIVHMIEQYFKEDLKWQTREKAITKKNPPKFPQGFSDFCLIQLICVLLYNMQGLLKI